MPDDSSTNTDPTLQPPAGLPFFVAHTPPKGQQEPWHPLPEHASEVTHMACDFARSFQGHALAEYVGWLHDLGKFDTAFQLYLWRCYLADRGQGPRPKAGSAPHKQAGALVAWTEVPLFGKMIAQLLFGHHGGMLSEADTYSKACEWQTRAADSVEEMRCLAASLGLDPKRPGSAQLLALFPKPFQKLGSAAQEMYLRFVFSCLTDADSLDTERHGNRAQSERRESERNAAPTLIALRDTLRENQQALRDGTEERQQSGEMAEQEQRVNAVRYAVYQDCRSKATALSPGVFTLTVPTGGGKTRSSLAFGLEHAVEYNKQRVIYAAPFTSILDQTADQFTQIFGADSRVVLEHHSAVDPPEPDKDETDDERESWRRLASENWDAPLIVTTQVQLFESLFSNRPGKCRKLHRIANSVLILDEVQSLPLRLLAPLVSALNLLAKHFHVSIVLCTATQPALTGNTAYLKGFETPPVEIVTERDTHFTDLKRVTYEVLHDPMSWAQVADAVERAATESGGCLCIVNARRSAKGLIDLLDPDRTKEHVFHLSTLLCGRHRRVMLDTVRERLARDKKTILVSTSVVESGVDVDFPRLFRALAPLPSLIQAAGRCNREGRRDPEASRVTIFTPTEDVIPADTVYKAAREQTKNALERAANKGAVFAFDNPDIVTIWFRQFLYNLGNQTDAFGVMPDIRERHFDTVAQKVRLIPDETVPVLPMQYAPAECQAILDTVVNGQLTREHWRALRPFLVSIYKRDADNLSLKDDEYPGLYLWHSDYDAKTGLPLDADPGDGIVRRVTDLII